MVDRGQGIRFNLVGLEIGTIAPWEVEEWLEDWDHYQEASEDRADPAEVEEVDSILMLEVGWEDREAVVPVGRKEEDRNRTRGMCRKEISEADSGGKAKGVCLRHGNFVAL